MGLSPWKFIAIDYLAAGLSVPTQVLLVSFYGKQILEYFTRFKIFLASVLALAAVVYFTKKYLKRRRLALALAKSTSQNLPTDEAQVSKLNSDSNEFRSGI
jgi:hypothetical protein